MPFKSGTFVTYSSLIRNGTTDSLAPMSNRALTLARSDSLQVPAIVADVGPEATKRFFEFFTVPVRNKNTRIAYYHAIGEFLAWSARRQVRVRASIRLEQARSWLKPGLDLSTTIASKSWITQERGLRFKYGPATAVRTKSLEFARVWYGPERFVESKEPR
jgi:hypothetical protein